MTPAEIAMKFSSASATCRGNKCPYCAECRGTTETCKLKEVAITIRALVAENTTLRAKSDLLSILSEEAVKYIKSLEQVNDYYYNVIKRFQDSYRPKVKVVKKDARMYRKRKPKDVHEMDGDERYAYEEPKVKNELPVVII